MNGEMQKPVAWRYVPSDHWRETVVTDNPEKAQLAQEFGREVMPLYTADQMREYALEATRQAMERCALIANSWSDKSFEAEQIEAEIRLAMADEIRSALSDVAAQEGKQHG